MKLNRCANRVTTPFGDFQIDVDNLFDHVFGNQNNSESKSAHWSPRVTVSESETGYTLDIELPGVDPADVNLEITENRLEISGEKKSDDPAEGTKRIRDERLAGAFVRRFEFSQLVDAESIRAEYRQGVLHVEVPKAETVLPRKIEIKVSE